MEFTCDAVIKDVYKRQTVIKGIFKGKLDGGDFAITGLKVPLFEKNGIYCMPLKGIRTKQFYPYPEFRTMGAVSYTHLDVYKRQAGKSA